MSRARHDGEPVSRGQLDRRAAERRALGDALFAAAFFGGVVLVNGILAILLIALFQAIGWWEIQSVDGAHAAALLSGRLRYRQAAAGEGWEQ